MRLKSIWFSVFVALLIGLCASSEAAEMQSLKIGTASPGGQWYLFGATFCGEIKKALPSIREAIPVPGGSLGNIQKVEKGEIDLSMAYRATLVEANRGLAAFKKSRLYRVRYIGPINWALLQIIVRRDVEVRKVEDLKDKQVNLQNPAAAVRQINETVLRAYGITPDTIKKAGGKVFGVGYEDAKLMMQNKQLDSMLTVTGYAPHVITMAETGAGIQLLPVDDVHAKEILKSLPGFGRITIPKGMYKNVDSEVPTIGQPVILVCRADLPDDLVYKLTSIFFESGTLKDLFKTEKDKGLPKAMDLSMALFGMDEPVHPGAMKYMKDHSDVVKFAD